MVGALWLWLSPATNARSVINKLTVATAVIAPSEAASIGQITDVASVSDRALGCYRSKQENILTGESYTM